MWFTCGLMPDVKLISATCPRCGASLQLPWNSPKAVCEYCGAEVLISAITNQAIMCEACQGFGKVDICSSCNGSGVCAWSTRSGGSLGKELLAISFSSHCEDGLCSGCHGSGRHLRETCPACNGTGKCPQCLGTGKCAACRGLGNFPNPNGFEECTVCHGKGVIPAGGTIDYAPVTMAVCAECGKAIHDEDSQCPYCGFVRRKCPQCGAAWVPRAEYCLKCGFGRASQ